MPGVTITGSDNIAQLNSKIVANLCDGNFYIDISPSIFIGDGDENVLGAKFQILNPYGVVIKDYDDDYEVAPGLSGGVIAAISFPIPTAAGNYQYGQYTVNAKLYDADGTPYIVTKTVKICEPDKKNKTRNYGSLSALMKVNCVADKLYIIVDSVPNYNGAVVESQTLSGSLEYPTGSELAPLSFTIGNFSVKLFEGVYKLTAEICATYNYGDNVYVKVKYKVKKEHHARCLIDRCCVFSKLDELHQLIQANCTDEEKERTAAITVDALRLLETAELAAYCGEDPSPYIEELEKLLGCKCTCNCSEGAPIINNDPTTDVVIEGCNVSVEINGNTKTYTINNYDYEVEIVDNGGALVVSAIETENCTKKQVLTFNIATVYSQIKNLANQNNTEGDFWASVVNKALRDVDPQCLELTAEEWQALTFKEKFDAVLTKMCACCGSCGATITNPSIEEVGSDVVLTWEGSAYVYEVYLDGQLVATILTSAYPSDPFTVTFIGAADGQEHEWLIISRCSDKSIGQTQSGTFQELGCAEIPAVLFNEELLTNGVASGPCPFDLNTLISISTLHSVEWHTADNTLPSSLVTNPASVGGGNYWAFAKDGNCYSVGKKVTILCSEEESCTAPQNLSVVKFGAYNFFVQFQSAAYPPPANSYTVKRRLASDPDVGGSYTTIGNPTWNASLNRWVIADETAENNKVYVYRAISNCGSTEPSVDFTYVYHTCPALTAYPTDTVIYYSFTPHSIATTGVTEEKVQLFDSSGTVLIHEDSWSPETNDPIEGSFEYLSPSTTYKVRIQLKYGSIIKNCTFQTVVTDASP